MEGDGSNDDNEANIGGAGPSDMPTSGAGGSTSSGIGGARRLNNMDQQMFVDDNTAAAAAATGNYAGVQYGGGVARGGPVPVGMNGLGMYGGGLGASGAFRSQFDDPSGGGMNAMHGLAGRGVVGVSALQQQHQAMAVQQQAMAAHQAQQQFGGPGDFQGLMPTGFEGVDQSVNMMGNPAAMVYNPYGQAGLQYHPTAVGGVDGTSGLNPNTGAAGGGTRNPQFANQAAAQATGSLFDQGYNFARSEMLARHQVAFNNNAALMPGGGQASGMLFGNSNPAAGLRGLGHNPYGNYGADLSLMGGASGPGPDPYLSRSAGASAGTAPAQHLATMPAIRLAQQRSALPQRMLVNNLPERKDGSFPVVLYQENDEHKLTAYQCLIRKQLELFEADEDDVRCSTRQGRTAPIKLGQVGLRCRHCAGVQLAARTKGAAYYSQTVEGIYQIAQNMSKVHLCERCYRIPRDVRRQLIVLRSDCRRAIGGKEYWSDNIRSLGVYVEEGILRVKHDPKKEKKEEGGNGEEKEEKDSDDAMADNGAGKVKDEIVDIQMSIEGEEKEKNDGKKQMDPVVAERNGKEEQEDDREEKDEEESDKVEPTNEDQEKSKSETNEKEQKTEKEDEKAISKKKEGDEEVVVEVDEKYRNSNNESHPQPDDTEESGSEEKATGEANGDIKEKNKGSDLNKDQKDDGGSSKSQEDERKANKREEDKIDTTKDQEDDEQQNEADNGGSKSSSIEDKEQIDIIL